MKINKPILIAALIVFGFPTLFSSTDVMAESCTKKNTRYEKITINLNPDGFFQTRKSIRSKWRVNYYISGEDFQRLTIQQAEDTNKKFKYDIRRLTNQRCYVEFLGIGSTNNTISINSDGQSIYWILLINDSDNKRRAVFNWRKQQ